MNHFDPFTVDAIGTEEENGTVVLSIVDSWDWTDEQAHLEALQAKINAYFDFIESDQLLDAYPAANNRPLSIDVVTKHQLADCGIHLLNLAMKAAEALGVSIASKQVG